jgi:hypothetical protein
VPPRGKRPAHHAGRFAGNQYAETISHGSHQSKTDSDSAVMNASACV